MNQGSGAGPSLTEAMGILMQALQNEAEIFIKLVSVYSKGGAGWDEVRETIERVYEGQQQAPKPAAEPADAEPADNTQASESTNSRERNE